MRRDLNKTLSKQRF